MKRKMMLVTLVLAVVMAFGLAACGGDDNKPAPVYEFEGVKDVHIASDITEYDFAKNVSAYKDLAETEFTVDSSGVIFGTPGKYTAVYKIDDYKFESNVYVYGNPQFTSSNAVISYSDAQTDAGLKKGLIAKDTFDNELDITVTQGISGGGALDYILYGDYTVKYSATDRVGNTATYTRTVTVSEEGRPVFDDIEVDLSDIEQAVLLQGQNVLKIFTEEDDGLTELTSEEYSFAGGYLSFKEDFLLSCEDVTDLRIVTDKGYNTAKLKFTDNKPANFRFAVRDAAYATSVSLPKAEVFGHQRNITFTYELKDSQNRDVTLTDNGDDFSFTPGGRENIFTFTAKAWRNGGQDAAGEKAVRFKLHDNVLAVTVSPDGENVNYEVNPDDFKVTYTAEYKHGTDLGSVLVENIAPNDAGSGVVTLRLRNTVASVQGDKALSLWVYCKTNVSLGADLYTDSGWWLNPAQGLVTPGRLALSETVSVQGGKWNKLTLNYDPVFIRDGGIEGMVTKEVSLLVRIYTVYEDESKNWSWDKSQGDFGLYISNVYREINPAAYGINYGEEVFVPTGVEGAEFSLPLASATDERITFDYEVKKDTSTVNYDKTTLTFVPQNPGDYSVTVIAELRDEEVARKTLDFTVVEDNLLIQTAAYYTYDNTTGKVTLPAAHVPAKYDGKSVRYSVRLGAGAETVLDADRVFDTGKTNGDYTYKADVLDGDGVTVLETVSVTLKIHADNVMLGLGRDASSVDAAKLANQLGNGRGYEYTTEFAAPGELGCAKLDNSGISEKGNFALSLGFTNVTAMSQIVFYVRHTGSQPLQVRLYSPGSGFYINYWVNGSHYDSDANQWNDYPITGSADGGWTKVEVNIKGTVSPGEWNDIRLMIISNPDSNPGYPWGEGDPAVIYISNIYGVPRA